MDFASLMSAQISKAKPAGGSADSKYLKKSDVEAERLADYEAEQRRSELERREKVDRKRKLEAEEAEREQIRSDKRRRLAEESRRIREEEEQAEERARRRRLGLPDLPEQPLALTGGSDQADGEHSPEDDEVMARLRSSDEPATLFGETAQARLKRYQRLRARIEAPVYSKGPIPTTLKLVPEAEMRVPDSIPSDAAGKALLSRQLASYFTMVLSEWDKALARRDDEVRRSSAGKQAYNAMVQARENMVPLFRKLERDGSSGSGGGGLDKAILEPVVEIVRCCQARRYVDANDAYLRLSIGKAAWPIGVTMVGIHARSAREKLHEADNAAHIMSDEVTRKYLQSIKRCLSFAQTRWPPDDQLQLMG